MYRRPSVSQRAALLLGAAVFSTLAITGCSGSEAPRGSSEGGTKAGVEAAADPGSTDSDELRDAQLESGVPAGCLDAFPTAFGAPDLAAATLMPADWPSDAVAGTLCQTAATGDGLQTIDWATDASGAEVLDAVVASLPPAYSVTREDKGLGEQLDGTAGDVYFTVRTRPGAWTLQLAPAS